MATHWIAGATKNKGALRKKLNIHTGKTIPVNTLHHAAMSDDKKEAAEARLALTLKKMHHK